MLFKPSVEVESEHLVFRPWLFRKRIALDAIRRIEGVKRDLASHEENYLLLFLDDGRTFWLGELDPGFGAAEIKLRERFQPFNPHWMGSLERTPAGTRQIIWDREQGDNMQAWRFARLRKRSRVKPRTPRQVKGIR